MRMSILLVTMAVGLHPDQRSAQLLKFRAAKGGFGTVIPID